MFNEEALLGTYGADYISGTGANTGKWCALQAVGTVNVTFTTLTVGNSTGLASMTLQPGMIVYLPITAITLATGTVLAYKDPTASQ